MDLKQWCKVAEELHAKWEEEEFKMKAGLEYSEKLMNEVAAKSKGHSIFLLNNFKEPRVLVLKSIATIAGAEALETYLKMVSVRNEKIRTDKYKFKDKEVTWNVWGQFFQTLPKERERKEVVDEFLSKVPFITPYIERYFNIGKEVFRRYDIKVLEYYLELERLTLQKLKDTIEKLGGRVKKLFKDKSKNIEKILGKPLEYYDTYPFLNALLLKGFNKHFAKLNPVVVIQQTLKNMGLDATRVKVDDEYREKKIPVAWCYWIRIPSDVRITFIKTTPLRDFELAFHEFGHGIHFSTIRADLPYWIKYVIPNGIAETFSTLLEDLSSNFLFLQQFVSKDIAEKIENIFKFFGSQYVSSYCANSLTKISLWEKRLTLDQINDLYSNLTERFMGIKYPRKYWQLHHIMPDYFLYAPSYLIASVRAAELEKLLIDNAGEKWWREKEAGKILKELMEAGGNIDLSFSKLDIKPLIDGLK